MKHLRNVPYVDLQRYGVSLQRYPTPTPRRTWRDYITWTGGIVLSLGVWVALLLLALWWRA